MGKRDCKSLKPICAEKTPTPGNIETKKDLNASYFENNRRIFGFYTFEMEKIITKWKL